MAAQEHAHEDQAPTGFDWFRVLDIAIWISVALIAVIAAEQFVGYLVRERIARGADKLLAASAPKE